MSSLLEEILNGLNAMFILDYPDRNKPILFEEFFLKILFKLTSDLQETDKLLDSSNFEE